MVSIVTPKRDLRKEAMDGKTERKNQEALKAPIPTLESLIKEYSGSTDNKEIYLRSLYIYDQLKNTPRETNYFFEKGPGKLFLDDVEKRIAAHDLTGLIDVINKMLEENKNARENFRELSAEIASLATGEEMNRVAGVQGRVPGSPIAGHIDPLSLEKARNANLREKLPLLLDKYRDVATTGKAATLIADILRTFEDKKLRPEEKYTRAKSLLEEFKEDPSEYESKLSSGGHVAGGGSSAATQTQQGQGTPPSQKTQTGTQTAMQQPVQITTPEMQAVQIAEGTVFTGAIGRELTNLKILLGKIKSTAQIDEIKDANKLNKLLFLEAHLHMKNIDEASRRAIADLLNEANEAMKEKLKQLNDEAEKTGGKKLHLVMEDISRIRESKDFKRIDSFLGTMLDQMDATMKEEYKRWAAYMMSLGLPPDDFYKKVNDSYLSLRKARRGLQEGKVEIPDSAVTLEFEQ